MLSPGFRGAFGWVSWNPRLGTPRPPRERRRPGRRFRAREHTIPWKHALDVAESQGAMFSPSVLA